MSPTRQAGRTTEAFLGAAIDVSAGLGARLGSSGGSSDHDLSGDGSLGGGKLDWFFSQVPAQQRH